MVKLLWQNIISSVMDSLSNYIKYQNLDSWHIDFVRRMQALLSRLAIQTLNNNGNLKKFLTFICCSQKIKFILTFFLRYYKDIVNLMFWVHWVCLDTQIQSDTINLQKTLVFICRQKINFTTMLFWRYCKDMQTSYYGYIKHTWLHTPKIIVLTCRRL